MGSKRLPARKAVKPSPSGSTWIDHAYIEDDDIEWLASVERLSLWNVLVPPGFLTKLDRLWCLTIHGGSATDLSIVKDAKHLRFLGVGSVRGMQNLAALTELPDLEFLRIGGLHQVTEFPSLSPLVRLERVQIGPMRGLTRLADVLDAPALRELVLIKKIAVTDSDVDQINRHPSLTHFYWFWEDVPVRVAMPVLQRIKLPQAPIVDVLEWFERRRPN